MKKLVQNTSMVLLGIVALAAAWFTATGDILNYINFSDPLGEMGFCMCSLMVGTGCLISGLSKA